MPVHRFYWELIARQNWEAIGIDQWLYGARAQTSKQAPLLICYFSRLPSGGRRTSLHAFYSYVFLLQSLFLTMPWTCFASAGADSPPPLISSFLLSTVSLISPHFFFNFIFYPAARGVRKVASSSMKSECFCFFLKPIRMKSETWIFVTGPWTL